MVLCPASVHRGNRTMSRNRTARASTRTTRDRSQKRLSAAQIKAWDGINPPELNDGGGLYLQGSKSGIDRSWRLRITLNGKRTTRGLGSLANCSLAEARRRADEIRTAARDGRDLAKEEKRGKQTDRRETFREAFDILWKHKKEQLSNGKHQQQWVNTMEDYVMSYIGDMPVDEVRPDDIIAILGPIWNEKPETASRVKQRLSAVFDTAIVRGVRTKANPTTGVTRILGSAKKAKSRMPSLDWRDVPQFVDRLHAGTATPSARLALEFLILTATRSKETRGALWSEFDFDDRLWTIPSDRMKTKRVEHSAEHRVPLSTRMIAVLEQAKRKCNGSHLVFPGTSGGMLSDSTMSKMMREDMGLRGAGTPHGFRSSFKNWCADNHICRDEVSERALAHKDSNAVRAAYRRTDYLDERRDVMERWGRYVSGLDWSTG